MKYKAVIFDMDGTVLNTIEDITDYAWPPFDVRAGRIPVIMEATRLCREHYGDRVFVKTCTDSAPFSLAACLCGPEDWMVALLDDEEAAKALLDRCVDVVSARGRAAYEAGAHAIAFGDSAASLISREMYAAFALPFAKKAIAAIHRDTGLPVFYHICGNTAHIVDLMADTGADCLELDSMVDLGWAREATGGRYALEGNVSTIQAFLNGKTEDVRREADALLKRFGRGGGFILGSACEVPRYTPRENVMALTRAAVEYHYNEA